jgi:alpha-glucosidase
MDETFPMFQKWGVAGVKIDFMDRADQWMVDWYRRVRRTAADHRLMIEFHGAYKPDGKRRTWPT